MQYKGGLIREMAYRTALSYLQITRSEVKNPARIVWRELLPKLHVDPNKDRNSEIEIRKHEW